MLKDSLLYRLLMFNEGAISAGGYELRAFDPSEYEEEEELKEVQYIGNANTKKFHYPYCSSVSKMKESNKVDLYSREEAISKGYNPCKNCDP